MALLTPLVQQNSSYAASALRDLVAMLPGVGPLRFGDLAVSERGSGPNMSVDVSAGLVVIENEVASRGRYLCRSTAVENVAIAAAPGAGSSRIDLVVAEVSDAEYGGTDGWSITAVTGSASSSPTAPSASAGAVVLAQVAVGSEVAAITDANVTDLRVFAAPTVFTDDLPVSGVPGQVVVGSDGTPHWRTGSGWVPGVSAGLFGAREFAVSSFSVPTSTVTVTGSTLSIPQPSGPVAVHASFDGRCAEGGAIEVHAEVSFNGGSSWAQGVAARQQTDGSAPQAISCHATKTGTPSGSVQARLRATRIGGSTGVLTGQWSMVMQPSGA